MSAQSTEERVRAAALRLFAERGYHGTGIRQLGEAAGLSSASLYHYMGTKEDLLVALMRESLERIVAAAEHAVQGAHTPVERLEALVRVHVTTHAQDPDRTRVVDDEVRALSAAARAPVIELRDGYERLWQQVIDEGVGSGDFAVTDSALVRRALLEMCSGVARWWTPGGRLTLDALADEYAALAGQLVGASGATRR